jgi:hypothetical protein
MGETRGKTLMEVFAEESQERVSLGELADQVTMIRYHLDLASIALTPDAQKRELVHAQDYVERVKNGLDRAIQQAKENSP